MEVTWGDQLEEGEGEAGSWAATGSMAARIGDPWNHREDMEPGAWVPGNKALEGERTYTGHHSGKQGSICKELISQSLEEEDSPGRLESFHQHAAAKKDNIHRTR